MVKKSEEGLGKRTRTSKNVDCDTPSQHKKGMRYFILAFLFLVASLIVGLAEFIFSVSVSLWMGWSVFYIIGLIISIGFWIFLILGILSYFKCDFKTAISGN